MEIIAGIIVLFIVFRRPLVVLIDSMEKWTNIVAKKSDDNVARADHDSKKFNLKTVEKLEALDDHFKATDVAKISKELESNSLAAKLAEIQAKHEARQTKSND